MLFGRSLSYIFFGWFFLVPTHSYADAACSTNEIIRGLGQQWHPGNWSQTILQYYCCNSRVESFY